MYAFDDATAAYVNRWRKNLENTKGSLRVVDLPGADHYLFLSNEEDVLPEVRAFVMKLR